MKIIVGIVLIILQLIGIIGNAQNGYEFRLSFENINVFFYDLFSLLGYFLIGLIGLLLLISGLVEYRKFVKQSQCKNEEGTSPVSENIIEDNNEDKQSEENNFSNPVVDPHNEVEDKSTNSKPKTKKLLQSKSFLVAICILLCIVSYVFLLNHVFTDTNTRTTYICYTTKTGTHYHSEDCKYLNTSYETTVYEASKIYKACEYCNPYKGANRTTVTLTERNYIAPILICVPISVTVFIILLIVGKHIGKQEDANTNS